MIAFQRPAKEYFGGGVRHAAEPLHLATLDLGTNYKTVIVRTS